MLVIQMSSTCFFVYNMEDERRHKYRKNKLISSIRICLGNIRNNVIKLDTKTKCALTEIMSLLF